MYINIINTRIKKYLQFFMIINKYNPNYNINA